MNAIRSILATIADSVADVWTEGILGKCITALLAATVVLACLIPYAIYTDAKELDAWKARCADLGETRVETTTQSGVLPAGKSVVITSDTTYYCLSSDDRILSVRD